MCILVPHAYKPTRKVDCRFLHGIAVLVIGSYCVLFSAERPCWDWWSVWLHRSACSLGWAGCHVAKDPSFELPMYGSLGHAGAAPFQERCCEELAWGWLAVEVWWCCQGMSMKWCGCLPMSLGMWQCPCGMWLPSSCMKEESVWFEICETRVQAFMSWTVWLFPTQTCLWVHLRYAQTKVASFSSVIIFIVLM